MKAEKVRHITRGVEYYPETNTLLLIICPQCGRENWAPQVASGTCVWCGFNGRTLLKEENGNQNN